MSKEAEVRGGKGHLVWAIEHFPKGSIWQTRYLSLPVVLIVSTRALIVNDMPLLFGVLWLIVGVIAWSLMEYLLHRFLLHWEPSGKVGRVLLDRLHAIHHRVPKDKTQVCVPLLLSAPLWLSLCLAMTVFGVGLNTAILVICGIALASVVYDIIHYASHYGPVHNSWMRVLKRNHMFHHHGDHTRRFGVSSPFWDYVFRTF